MVQNAVVRELDVSAKGDCDSLWVLTFRKKINLLLLWVNSGERLPEMLSWLVLELLSGKNCTLLIKGIPSLSWIFALVLHLRIRPQG